MKIKELIRALSKFPEDLEVTIVKSGLEGFWKGLDIDQQFGFYLEDEDGFFEPIIGDMEDETYGRNIKFVAIK